MKLYALALIALLPELCFAMAKGPVDFIPAKGKSQSQVNSEVVWINGQAAKFLYESLQVNRGENLRKDGKVVTCHEGKNVSEYSCTIGYTASGVFVAYRDTFTTTKSSRGIASVGNSTVKGGADAYYIRRKDKGGIAAENVLVVINGGAAAKLYEQMSTGKDTKPFTRGDGVGYRGENFACVKVQAIGKPENPRCSFTVSVADGRVVHDFNPLY